MFILGFILGFIIGGLVAIFLMAIIEVGDVDEKNDISKR